MNHYKYLMENKWTNSVCSLLFPQTLFHSGNWNRRRHLMNTVRTERREEYWLGGKPCFNLPQLIGLILFLCNENGVLSPTQEWFERPLTSHYLRNNLMTCWFLNFHAITAQQGLSFSFCVPFCSYCVQQFIYKWKTSPNPYACYIFSGIKYYIFSI